MCGITGMLSVENRDARTVVSRMAARLSHRGPDGAGHWQSSATCTTLANARLAIFDPGPAAAQPMSIDDGRLVITFNGAIYNCHALRASLEAEGVRFSTVSDTEVVLRAYARHGRSCVDRLKGMFAFVIWDERERCAFLARDWFGIKPLYYAERGGDLLFASEMRAIAASRCVSADLDDVALYGYFRHGSVAEPRTLLRQIRTLPAGATATWRDGRLTVHQPEEWPRLSSPLLGDAAGPVRRALLESVERHFEGDVPVGVLLSGGIDSGALVALARAGGRTDVRTFALSFPGDPADEGADAQRSATHFGVAHEQLPVDAAAGRRALSDYARAIDQPSIDGLNIFIAARFARERGIKVLLSGIGADEMFGGYSSFWRVPRLQRWHRLAAVTGPIASWTGTQLERNSNHPKARRAGDLLQQSPSLINAYETFRGIYTRGESRALVRHFGGGEVTAEAHPTEQANQDPIEAVGRLELTRYVRNQLLRDGDVMSMASGVELRTPYLDRDVAGTLWALPTSVRVQPGKRLLAEAVPEMPAWTMAMPKRCFQLPFERWLAGDWRDVFASIEASCPVPADTWYRKWSVFSLERSLQNVRESMHA